MTGLIIDNFAGGGGASTGIEAAIGRAIDVAINHDPEAIAMHRVNHPDTFHYCQDVWEIDPLQCVRDASMRRFGHPKAPVDLAWFSPDCKHFSKAKGGKPLEKKIRDLAWVVHRWIDCLKPTDQHPLVIMLENVEEFQTYGPLLDDGRPCPIRKGETFRAWVQGLRDRGYKVEYRELKACDYGAPTTRKRLFLIARRDGLPIIWPEPTHGAGRPMDWRTAADIIDWSIPCPSIFTRTRPLKEATCRRIATGIMRYVINAERPFIVPLTHHGSDSRVYDLDQPIPTVTGANRGEMALAVPAIVPVTQKNWGGDRAHNGAAPLPTITTAKGGEFALMSPTLVTTGYGEREGQKPRVPGLDKPLGAVVAGGGKHALVSAFLAQHNGGPRNKNIAGHAADKPVSTITGRGTQQQLVTSNLVKMRGGNVGHAADMPLQTISAGGTHFAEVRAFLIKYYGNERDGHTLFDPLGTVTTKDRFGMVTVSIDGTEYAIADIGMRMLSAKELYAAQGFPADYIIDFDYNGKPLTKTAQVRMVGNSVSPPLPAALVRANLPQLCPEERIAA
jgi:DNA (cytosine-5)-methyltransferase 1